MGVVWSQVTFTIDHRVGEGLETAWASNNFYTYFQWREVKPAYRLPGNYGKL